MSVTRTKLLACKVKGCPEPESEEWHVCWVREYRLWPDPPRGKRMPEYDCFGGVTHQHTRKRSQGGKVIDACLCAGHHDRIDNGLWGNKIVDGVWVAYDENHTILARRSLNGSVSEPETLEGAGAHARSSGSDTAPLIGGQDGQDSGVGLVVVGEQDTSHMESELRDAVRSGRKEVVQAHSRQDVGVQQVSGQVLPAPAMGLEEGTILGSVSGGLADAELTRAECIRLAQQLRAERERNPWMTGDLLNAAARIDDPDNSWDGVSGESLLDILRLQPETASNYQRVCQAYGPAERVSGLTFGHHQSCYKLPDRDSWLKLAVDEGLSVSELRRRIKPPQSKAKRWTLEQLRIELGEFERGDDTCRAFAERFLEWLGSTEGSNP